MLQLATTDPRVHLEALEAVLADLGPRTVACSGGIDSLLLATVAHRQDPDATVVAHTVTPAVPSDATARVLDHGRRREWRVELVRSHEFDDERYLANPADRCYFCKTNLYEAVAEVSRAGDGDRVVVSGANRNDLGEYRPGLVAAAEHGVRHPYVEVGMGKADIRALARHLGLAEAELPASPCLASRLYTGTRVTAERLRAVELGEAVLRSAGAAVVRCRLRDNAVLIEVAAEDRHLVTAAVRRDVAAAMSTATVVDSVVLDERAYGPGRAVATDDEPTRVSLDHYRVITTAMIDEEAR